MLKHLKHLYSLSGPVRGMAVLGIFLSVITTLSSVALMAVSGWFIAAMALAGAIDQLLHPCGGHSRLCLIAYRRALRRTLGQP